MIEIEVQNETTQTQERLRFAAVPRIGEGLRLRGSDGLWASYDILDVWYQRAEYGDVWVPYLHVRLTPPDGDSQLHDSYQDPIGEGAMRAVMSPFGAGAQEWSGPGDWPRAGSCAREAPAGREERRFDI